MQSYLWHGLCCLASKPIFSNFDYSTFQGAVMLIQKLAGALVIVMLSTGLAFADLDGYLNSLRISADANFGDFRAGLGAHFGASGAELDHVFLSVGHPADAACLFSPSC
jgi:hypothetical protein